MSGVFDLAVKYTAGRAAEYGRQEARGRKD